MQCISVNTLQMTIPLKEELNDHFKVLFLWVWMHSSKIWRNFFFCDFLFIAKQHPRKGVSAEKRNLDIFFLLQIFYIFLAHCRLRQRGYVWFDDPQVLYTRPHLSTYLEKIWSSWNASSIFFPRWDYKTDL